uniref:S41 family peptidase n=1 Tax=Robertmurraya sp. TaxID=2837525 RepID=UPI003703FA38
MNRKWVALLMTGSLLTGAGGTYGYLHYTGALAAESKVELHTESSDEGTPQAINLEELEKVEKAYELILTSYVESVDQEKLIEGAIQGMLTTLDDPYSVYMDKETAKQFSSTLESSFEGIGAEVGLVDGKIVIVSPFKDSPAEKAGLRPNDQILSVDGESLDGVDLYEATLKIRGKKGTKVKLEIARSGLSEPLVVNVKRDEIPQITVHSD